MNVFLEICSEQTNSYVTGTFETLPEHLVRYWNITGTFGTLLEHLEFPERELQVGKIFYLY